MFFDYWSVLFLQILYSERGFSIITPLSLSGSFCSHTMENWCAYKMHDIHLHSNTIVARFTLTSRHNKSQQFLCNLLYINILDRTIHMIIHISTFNNQSIFLSANYESIFIYTPTVAYCYSLVHHVTYVSGLFRVQIYVSAKRSFGKLVRKDSNN